MALFFKITPIKIGLKKTMISLGPDNLSDTYLKDFDLHLHQPKEGYRFSVDSILLVEFIRLKKGAKVLDIGAGCGVIGLCLLRRYRDITLKCIELQEQLFELACINIARNGLSDRAEAIRGDFSQAKKFFGPGEFDAACANPPYRSPDSGRLCPEAQEALSRHEISLDLNSLLEGVRYVVRPGGHFFIIYPADRAALLLGALREFGLEPKRFQSVYPRPGKEARMCMVDAVKDGRPGGLHILDPLYVEAL